MNIKEHNKSYNWHANTKWRKKQWEKLVKRFKREEEADLQMYNNPSPRGIRWRVYIEHRFRMAVNGIPAYTKKYYARLRFGKYIDVNRILDEMAMKIVPNGRRALIYLGAADIAPDSPISIPKFVRAPGARRLMNSVRKRPGCARILKVDEYMTSQTCAKCFARFDRRTRSHHFKVCRNCVYSPEMLLTTSYQTQSRRALAPIIHEIDPEWQLTLARTTVWHRDIVAAKCILYKGMYCIVLNLFLLSYEYCFFW